MFSGAVVDVAVVDVAVVGVVVVGAEDSFFHKISFHNDLRITI